ncbi:chymotrypsin BI-like [Lucilia sericata]|uniref:chymotrypsin BI-like n=1 Tax=Lucilia sericata TaxID=13632 RepID=UPI0018A86C59|nr:chymotrypsin BI-like [Lucilia sericata]
MTGVLPKLALFGIICQLYLTTIASHDQSAPIISGKRATRGQFPWHALIWLEEDDEDVEICGGSIISDIWVLTAAHCLDNLTSVVLAFGTIDLWNNELNMSSSAFFIHPKYDPDTLFNDIALIKLPTSLKFNENIKTIDLIDSKESSNNFVGAPAIISGFGRTKDKVVKLSRWLLWATIEIVPNKQCDEAYKEKTPDTVLCAVGSNGTNMSACDGDSGGALVWKNPDNKFVQIGVFSYLTPRKCSKYPTGYTRLTSYLDYVKNVTGLQIG